ncbi:MAG: hypothetical protein Fur0035_15740 [Anaerolineales bacterium]
MSSGSNHLSRRDFIKFTTGAVGGIITVGLGVPAVGYLIDPALKEDKAGKPITVGKLADIPVGKPYPFSFTVTKVNGWERTAANYGGYVLRKSEAPEDILILSSRCTHLGCTVNWHEESNAYLCPCHDAKFSMEGQVLDGPPPIPLRHFNFTIEGEMLVVTPVEIGQEG